MKTLLLATTALIAISGGPATGWGHAIPRATYSVPPAQLLYSQNSNFGAAIPSDILTSSGGSSTFVSRGADDFVVPAGQTWRITEVDAAGTYLNGTGPAWHQEVNFYTNANGKPGFYKRVAESTCADDQGNLTCILRGDELKFSGGARGRRFWLSVVAYTSYYKGYWGWVENTKIRRHEGMWENPGGGYGMGCTTWGANDACTGHPGDYAFALRGRRL